jgi:hypothetical protein
MSQLGIGAHVIGCCLDAQLVALSARNCSFSPHATGCSLRTQLVVLSARNCSYRLRPNKKPSVYIPEDAYAGQWRRRIGGWMVVILLLPSGGWTLVGAPVPRWRICVILLLPPGGLDARWSASSALADWLCYSPATARRLDARWSASSARR